LIQVTALGDWLLIFCGLSAHFSSRPDVKTESASFSASISKSNHITKPASTDVIKILLVEDHTLVRRAFRRMLEDEAGLQVIGEAGDGQEAIQAVQDLSPDVVVMDFALPRMMGGAVTEHILQIAPNTAVLIVSMHSEPTYVRASLDAGARGYLLKSALHIDLVSAVRKVAAGHHVLDSRIILPALISEDATRPPTARELEVLQLIGHGKSNKEIAASLGISVGTVAVHRANIMKALALDKAAKLTLYAIGRGLVNVDSD